MKSNNTSQEGKPNFTSIRQKDERQKDERQSNPEWTDGLRELYDSVVDEPIPDSFMDLLSKLDSDHQDGD